MKKNLIRNKNELNRKLSQHFQESINQFEKLLRMTRCFSKMRFSLSNLLKENYGQTQKLLAVSLSNLKVLFIINVQLLPTSLAVRKDFLYN